MALKGLAFSALLAGGIPQVTPYAAGPCDGEMRSAPWCDTQKPFAVRAASLVADLSVDEKAGLFIATGTTGKLPPPKLPHHLQSNNATYPLPVLHSCPVGYPVHHRVAGTALPHTCATLPCRSLALGGTRPSTG